MGIKKRLLACFNSRFNASPEGKSGGEPQQDGKGAGLGLMPHRLADNNGDGLTFARSVECRHSSPFLSFKLPVPSLVDFGERQLLHDGREEVISLRVQLDWRPKPKVESAL